jgi:hypothetical protein
MAALLALSDACRGSGIVKRWSIAILSRNPRRIMALGKQLQAFALLNL